PIAPHLGTLGGVPGQVKLAEVPIVQNNVTQDTWNSGNGPYGGSNVGAAPTFQIGVTMPAITLPVGIGPSVGNKTLNNETLASNLHCNDLTISGIVQISGNRTIMCDGSATISAHSDLRLMPGATLKLYVTAGITSMPHTNLNAPATAGLPGLVTIYN